MGDVFMGDVYAVYKQNPNTLKQSFLQVYKNYTFKMFYFSFMSLHMI